MHMSTSNTLLPNYEGVIEQLRKRGLMGANAAWGEERTEAKVPTPRSSKNMDVMC